MRVGDEDGGPENVGSAKGCTSPQSMSGGEKCRGNQGGVTLRVHVKLVPK